MMWTLIYHDGIATRYEDFDSLDAAVHFAEVTRDLAAYEILDSEGFTVATKYPRTTWI